jgi:hypothetical protein
MLIRETLGSQKCSECNSVVIGVLSFTFSDVFLVSFNWASTKKSKSLNAPDYFFYMKYLPSGESSKI